LALFVVALAGQAQAQVTASEDSLVGTWAADLVAMMAGEMEGMEESERAMVEAMMEGASMTITFNADHTMAMEMSMMGETESEAGTWSLVSATGNTLVVQTTSPEGEVDTVTMVFNDENSVAATVDEETMLLNRVVAEETPAAPEAPATE
jgi:uncharacterized lipoprotein NlpE involved in copper resistance